MAIDEDVLYTVTGEEVTRSSIVNEMISYYMLKLEVGETKVTDFNEGSEIRNLLEAFAVDGWAIRENQNELTKIAFIQLAEGEYLDLHGAEPTIALARDQGSEAVGFLTFSIPDVQSNEIVIPEDTVVVCEENDLEYSTDAECIISIGDTSVTIGATCLTPGIDGNCSKETINLINDDYLDIPNLTVINEDDFTNGTDYEEDDEYRERLLSYVRRDDFGSLGYYEDFGNNIDGVHDVYLIDDRQGRYTKIILVNGNEKPTPDDVLLNVLEEFTNPLNIVVGHDFTVDKPTYVPVDLTVNLTVSSEIDEGDIRTVLEDLFNGGEHLRGFDFEGLSIGETLRKNSVYTVFEMFGNVEEVVVYHDEDILCDITPGETEVLELGELTINQTINE